MSFSQLSTSVTIINSGLIGYNGISLTNFGTSAISAIASGSGIEIAGAFFKADTDISANASSWTVISVGASAYMELVPSGTAGSQILTAQWTDIDPVWSTSKQGWYASAASNTKIIGRVTKVSSTQQSNKFLINKEDLIVQQRANDLDANTAIGRSALYANTTGKDNVAIGYGALENNTIGANNVAIGRSALTASTNANDNIAIGRSALLVANGQGVDNVAIGSSTLKSNIEGADNIAIGSSALQANESGNYNIAIGVGSLYLNTNDENIAIGVGSLCSNGVGYRNIAIGKNTLYYNSSGDNNIAIGSSVGGDNSTGDNNIFLGVGASNTASNLSNIINLGSLAITTLRCQVTTITALSDERDKKNIKDLSLGLDFVNKLRPVTFNWDMREWYAKKDENGIAIKNDENDYIYDTPLDGSKIGKIDYNFIAQELLVLQKEYPWLNIVNTDNPNKLETTPGKMFPILVKAIQQLSDKVKSLEERI